MDAVAAYAHAVAQHNVAQSGLGSALAQANHQQAMLQQTQDFLPLPAFPVPVTQPQLASRAREMFLKRMGGLRCEMHIHADDFLQCHIYQDTVFLFFCFGGRDGSVKESIDLFPSDQLITQFRLMLAAG